MSNELPGERAFDHTSTQDRDGEEFSFHCVTCSDEALPCNVLSVDEALGLALVEMHGTTTEVEVSLVGPVAPGDLLVVHGGVALSRLDE